MPNSLKCRLKKLEFQGLLSKKDLSRIYTDNDVIEELEHLKAVIRFNGLYNERIEDLIDIEIAAWKERINESRI